ncbi:MAG TPA: DUF1697 domain-containing protein [Terracidiphilus sp.]|nr:DUF1697 domain-containing protein [Terracidiphilus sp.]
MHRYVALLRAVNVGGYGKLSMADLRALLEKLGYGRVETYIQSGNAVFDAKGSAAAVAKQVAEALEKKTGASVGVLVRTHDELARVIEANPFAAEAAADGARVHVIFLFATAPKDATVHIDRIVEQYPQRRDRYHLAGDTLYLHLPDGAADTKFTGRPMDRALGGVMATARNWNTVLKLHAMSAPK